MSKEIQKNTDEESLEFVDAWLSDWLLDQEE